MTTRNLKIVKYQHSALTTTANRDIRVVEVQKILQEFEIRDITYNHGPLEKPVTDRT